MWFIPHADYASTVNLHRVVLKRGEPADIALGDVSAIVKDAGFDVLGPPVTAQQAEQAKQTTRRRTEREAQEQAEQAGRIRRQLERQGGQCAGWGGMRNGTPAHDIGKATSVHLAGAVALCDGCYHHPNRT